MTQIIDGFQLNAAIPIDSRMVTSGTASRNAILYKYAGLRVYDISANQPYVWNGSAWVSENSSAVTLSGTTAASYIPKFVGTSQITNSIIKEESNKISILLGVGSQPSDAKLEVAGKVKAQSFEGIGNAISQIKGSNVLGPIDISKLSNYTGVVAGDVYVLAAGSATPIWRKLSEIPSSSFPGAAINLDITSPGTTELFPIFTKSGGGSYSYYKTTGGDAFKFIPRVNSNSEGAQLQVPNGSEAFPSVAFSTNNNTGIYRAGWNILGISVAGSEKLRVNEQGVLVRNNAVSEPVFKVLSSGGRPFIGLYGTRGDSKLTGTIGYSARWRGGVCNDLIIENLSGEASNTFVLNDNHFDAANPSPSQRERHAINLNVFGQTIISSNIGSKVTKYTNGVVSIEDTGFTRGAYGIEMLNTNGYYGHGLRVQSGGGPDTVSARFDNGNKTIAYFTDRGLQIMSGTVDAPSICFDSDKSQGKNTGLYLETSSKIGIVAGNKKVLTISDKEIRLPKVSALAYIFGDDTRIEGTTRTNSLEIYRPTTNPGFAICHFYSDISGIKTAKAYIYPDGSYYKLSDSRQKENIESIAYGLDSINMLRPVSHTWKGSSSERKSVGFIAQEVEQVISEVVRTTVDGDTDIKALDYTGIVPVLVKAVQELSDKVKALESRQ